MRGGGAGGGAAEAVPGLPAGGLLLQGVPEEQLGGPPGGVRGRQGLMSREALEPRLRALCWREASCGVVARLRNDFRMRRLGCGDSDTRMAGRHCGGHQWCGKGCAGPLDTPLMRLH